MHPPFAISLHRSHRWTPAPDGSRSRVAAGTSGRRATRPARADLGRALAQHRGRDKPLSGTLATALCRCGRFGKPGPSRNHPPKRMARSRAVITVLAAEESGAMNDPAAGLPPRPTKGWRARARTRPAPRGCGREGRRPRGVPRLRRGCRRADPAAFVRARRVRCRGARLAGASSVCHRDGAAWAERRETELLWTWVDRVRATAVPRRV